MCVTKTIKLGDTEYSALRFGSDNYEMPLRVMQNTRECGLLITDDKIEEFPWYGVTKDRDGQYILLPLSEYEDISTIADRHRDEALSLVRKIALGLNNAPRGFSDLLTGIFPLYRIYIEKGHNIVLLPPDAGSILTLSRSPEETDRDVRALIKSDIEPSFTLASEMTQLLYYALSGRLPYESNDVRGSGYKPYPLSLYGFGSELSAFIMKTLTLKEKEMRLICLNGSAENTLGWFLRETGEYGWNEKKRSREELIAEREKAEKESAFTALREKKTKASKRRRIIREKGGPAIIIALVAAAVLYFTGNFLYNQFRAPLTKDLDPEGIIEYTIEKQNELDASSLNEGFKGEAAQYMEVTSLYVSSRTTLAYSQKNTIININDWLEGERGSIDSECIVYGVIIESIEESGENTYTATLKYYTPYPMYDDDDENNPERENTVRIFEYLVDETFVFEWNTRGWWQCISSSFGDGTLLSVMYIPYATQSEVRSD